MNLRPLIRFLSASWLLITVFAVAGVALAGAYAATQRPQYESTALLFVSTRSAASVADLSKGHSFEQGVVSSFVELATSRIVLDPVIRELGLHETAAQLAARIRVEVETGTVLLRITTLDPSPKRAADVSNAVSANLMKAVTTLSPGGSAQFKLQVIAPARPPASPTYRTLLSTLVLGMLAGSALGLIAARLRRGSEGGDGGMRAAPVPQLV